MSSLATRLVTWEEFVELPERTETGGHYELHDGEVVRVLPPADRHIALQAQIMRLLRPAEVFGFEILMEFPYRPTADLQYWKADVAIVPTDVRKAMARRSGLSWQVYAPPLVVEVLSPSNTDDELNRKRVVAMSAGTVEFWIVDGDCRTVHVTTRGGLRTYRAGENIALSAVAGVRLAVDAIFEDLV